MASRNDLTAIALRTLDDALAEAMHGPVRRTWGHRLALSWLRHCGIAQAWQARSFWREMAEADDSQACGKEGYVRSTLLTGALDNWYMAAGIPIPSCVQRGEWARRAKAMRR